MSNLTWTALVMFIVAAFLIALSSKSNDKNKKIEQADEVDTLISVLFALLTAFVFAARGVFYKWIVVSNQDNGPSFDITQLNYDTNLLIALVLLPFVFKFKDIRFEDYLW